MYEAWAWCTLYNYYFFSTIYIANNKTLNVKKERERENSLYLIKFLLIFGSWKIFVREIYKSNEYHDNLIPHHQKLLYIFHTRSGICHLRIWKNVYIESWNRHILLLLFSTHNMNQLMKLTLIKCVQCTFELKFILPKNFWLIRYVNMLTPFREESKIIK